jgi:hypothetical protein
MQSNWSATPLLQKASPLGRRASPGALISTLWTGKQLTLLDTRPAQAAAELSISRETFD